MADSLLKPPGQLDVIEGNISENYRKWKRQMEIYLTASGGSEKDPKIQTNIILHCAGQKVIEIYDQFKWETDGDNLKPDKLYEQLEKYCNPRKNEVLESHRFWQTAMEEFPSFESFLTEVRKRAESCNFQDLSDRMIRDKIVFSSSGKLQELLLREDKLELNKCIQICRAYEQSGRHVREMRESGHPVRRVSQAEAGRRAPRPSNGQNYGARPKAAFGPHGEAKLCKENTTCKFCGYEHELQKEKCPAWGKVCKGCGGRNHFKSRCKKVHTVTEVSESGSEDEFWLQCITSGMKSKVKAKMIVNDLEVDFQIDTGAEINTINRKFVRKSQREKKVTKLRMWNKSTVNSLGQTKLNVKNPRTGDEQEITFVIVPDEFECLLGLQTVQKLNLVTINSENFIGKVDRDLGDLGEVTLTMDEFATPKALPARNIPIAIKSDVKCEIERLVERGILEEVTEPTPWVSQMAVVRKSNGKIRICIDPQSLNKVLVRERYKLPTFEDILPELHNAKIFTKLDVKEAFYHVRLDKESSKLTTMITPFGRYKWKRLPFGLNVSSEIFQRKLCEALKGLEGVCTIADDIIVVGCGETEEEAKKDNLKKLDKLYARCIEQNIVLNEDKKDMGKEITFHGHKITDKGILPDDKKIEAVLKMKTPEDVSEVKRVCGLVQYMARFLPDLSETLEPLRNLTRKGVDFVWDEKCESAFQSVKAKLTKAPVLVYFDPDKDLVLQTDSSQSGLGVALLQEGKPIEFASRSLTQAERKWAQIEKEALSVLYGLEKFDQYTYGRKVTIQNDHKPLQNILRKPLSQAPKRLQDIMMKLFRYDIEFIYVKGTDLVIADTLSRAYIDTEEETRPRVFNVDTFEEFPDARVAEVREATGRDIELQKVMSMICEGWPDKEKTDPELRKYLPLRDTLTVDSGIILKGEAMYIPKALRNEMLKRLHSAHLGHQSMVRRARNKIFWIGMNNDIKQIARSCEPCEERKPQNQRQPLLQHSDGKGPWDKIATDIFVIENKSYLLVIDYFTNYIELDHLTTTTSKQVIEKLKKQFSRFGIPRQIVSDGGPQYSSNEFKEFAAKWQINHHITSPNHPNSNGKAEAGVKIAKQMMIKCVETKTDPYEALLELRNTPRADTGVSPHEMMFTRPARTRIPSIEKTIATSAKRNARKEQVLKHYNKKAKTLPKLDKGDNLYFQHNHAWTPGRVQQNISDRNYVVVSQDNTVYKRNRDHIRGTGVNVQVRDTSPPPPPPPGALADQEQNVNIDDASNEAPREYESASSTSHMNLRPRREIQPPKYLTDYVRN